MSSPQQQQQQQQQTLARTYTTSTKRLGMATKRNGPVIDAEAEGTHIHQKFTNPVGSSTRMPYLPNEIIIDILSRLPATSLVRFRFVCKSWLSLISDKKFIKNHLHMTTRDHNYSHRRVIFESSKDCFIFKSCSLDSIYSDPCVNPITLDPMITIKEPSIRYDSWVGSCDGLVCISTNEGIYLWNPVLRESRRLPRFKVDLRLDGSLECVSCYGFGYDYSSDDYKVVAVTLTNDFYRDDCQVDVYTLRSNSWRRIQAIPCRGGRIWSRGIFFKGALHWILTFPSNTLSIISLDLATETYHEIAHPTDGTHVLYNRRMLGVLGGCLCVTMADDFWGRKTNVWIMKDYGLENSWTKLTCFANLTVQISHGITRLCVPCNTPLFVSKTGEMLVIFESIINLYNLKDNTFRSPVIPHSLNCTYSATYVESIVSLRVEDSVGGHPEICNMKRLMI